MLVVVEADVLNTFETIKIATGYKIDGVVTQQFPYEVPDNLELELTEFEGWNCDINHIRDYAEFPVQFKNYVSYIEEQCGVPVKIISIGPDREETIIR